jgi:hypothetical protein
VENTAYKHRAEGKIGKKTPENANILAFFKKNVQNYLQECGFMPIFAPKLCLRAGVTSVYCALQQVGYSWRNVE